MDLYKKLASRLKLIIGLGIFCILVSYGYFMPVVMQETITAQPSLASMKISVYIIMFFSMFLIFYGCYQLWKLAESLGVHKTFTIANTMRLKRIARVAALFALIFSVLLLGAWLTGVKVISVYVIMGFGAFGAMAISVVASILQEIMLAGFDLQDEHELTI